MEAGARDPAQPSSSASTPVPEFECLQTLQELENAKDDKEARAVQEKLQKLFNVSFSGGAAGAVEDKPENDNLCDQQHQAPITAPRQKTLEERLVETVRNPVLYNKASRIRTCANPGCDSPNEEKASYGDCSKCGQKWYCSRTCQKDGWSSHKAQCVSSDLPPYIFRKHLFSEKSIIKASKLGDEPEAANMRRKRLLTLVKEFKAELSDLIEDLKEEAKAKKRDDDEIVAVLRCIMDITQKITCCYLHMGLEHKSRKYVSLGDKYHGEYAVIMQKYKQVCLPYFMRGFDKLPSFSAWVMVHHLLMDSEKEHEVNTRRVHRMRSELLRAIQLKEGDLQLPECPVFVAKPDAGESKKAKKNKAKAAQARAHALAAAEEHGPEAVARVTLENAAALAAEEELSLRKDAATLAQDQVNAEAMEAYAAAVCAAQEKNARVRTVDVMRSKNEQAAELCRDSSLLMMDLEEKKIKTGLPLLRSFTSMTLLWTLWQKNQFWMTVHNKIRDKAVWKRMMKCVVLEVDNGMTAAELTQVTGYVNDMTVDGAILQLKRPEHPDSNVSGYETLENPCANKRCHKPISPLTVVCGECVLAHYCCYDCQLEDASEHGPLCRGLQQIGSTAWLTWGDRMKEILNSTSDAAETREKMLDLLIDTKTKLEEEEKFTSPLNEKPLEECQHNFTMLDLKLRLMVLHLQLGAPHISLGILKSSWTIVDNFTDTMKTVRDIYQTGKKDIDIRSAKEILDIFEPQMVNVRTLLHAVSMDTRWQMRENTGLRTEHLLTMVTSSSMQHGHEKVFIELVEIHQAQIKFTTESSMLFRTFYAEWDLYHAVRKYWSCNKQAHVDYQLECISDVFPRTKKMHAPMLALFSKCKAQLLCRNNSRHMKMIMDDMQAKLKVYESGNPLPMNRVFLRLPPT